MSPRQSSLVARMERSVIRDSCVRGSRSPDFAALHPGYDPLRCPTGKTHHHWVNRSPSKHSYLQKFWFAVQPWTSRPATRGVSRPSRDAGRGAVDATASARRVGCRAEILREQRHARYDTALTASPFGFDGERTPAVDDADGDVRGRRSRVVLTPGVCASSHAVMWRLNRARASASCMATGAIVHRSPGRARRTPLKPTAQGRPGCLRRHLWSARAH